MALEEITVAVPHPPTICSFLEINVVVINPDVTGRITPVNASLELFVSFGINLSGIEHVVFDVVEGNGFTPDPLILQDRSPSTWLMPGSKNPAILAMRTRDAANYKVICYASVCVTSNKLGHNLNCRLGFFGK